MVNPDSFRAASSEAAQIAELKRQLQWAHLKIQALEERLRLERIKKYGPGSERHNCARLELPQLEPGVSHLEVLATIWRRTRCARWRRAASRRHPGDHRNVPAASLQVPVRGYLAAILPGVVDVSIHKLAELTPAAWAAKNR
jgi:hypothetical protein